MARRPTEAEKYNTRITLKNMVIYSIAAGAGRAPCTMVRKEHGIICSIIEWFLNVMS